MVQDPLQEYRTGEKRKAEGYQISHITVQHMVHMHAWQWNGWFSSEDLSNPWSQVFQWTEKKHSKDAVALQPNPLTTKCPGAVYICTFPQHGVCVVVVWSVTTVIFSVAAAAWCDELVVADGCDELVVLLFVLQWLWIFTSSTSHSVNTSTYHNSCLWPHLFKFTSPAHTHLYSFSIVISRILFSLKPM